MKRVLSLLLVCCFVILTLVACGPEEPEASETQGSETTAPSNTGPTEKPRGTTTETDTYGQNKLISAVPVDDLDFENRDLVVLIRDTKQMYREWGKKETDSEDVDATLDDAIATRNDIVKTDLNINIVMEYKATASYDDCVAQFNQFIRTDALTEESHLYDIVANQAYPAVNPQIRDCLANLADTDTFPYFDFELPCWNQAIVNNTKINNKIYAVAGDLTLSLFDYAQVIWCNYDLYKANKTEEDPEDLQQYAIDGNWVYDDLYRWAQVNDNTDTSSDCGDLHGFSTNFVFFDALPHAWDFNLVDTDNEGRHSFNVKENTKAQDCLDAVNILLEQVGVADYYDQSGNQICTCGKKQVSHFTEGDYVFNSDKIYWGETGNVKLREMDDTYIILPIPKWEAKNQKNYGTTCADTYNLISVIDHSLNVENPMLGEEVSAYLQYATEQSYTDVRKYYFERIIKPKTLGVKEDVAEKSMQIFDMIVDNIEFAMETIYSTLLNDIGWLWRDNILRGNGMSLSNAFESNSFSGGGARNEAQYLEKIQEFDAWIYDELE